ARSCAGKRRKLVVEAGREDPAQPRRLRDPLEVELAEVLALVRDLDGVGGEDLSAAGGLADAGGVVDGEPDEAVASGLSAAAVHAHAHAERRRPGLAGERTLSLDGGVDGARGVVEGGEELVAAPVDDAAAVLLDRGADQLSV